MITVKLLGGAKKALGTDTLEFEKNNSTITELFDFLQKKIPPNSTGLDTKNVLVAINGVDSSTLDSFETKLKDGDIVSIIPIIHGGSQRLKLKIFNKNVEFIGITRIETPVVFLENLRKKYHDLMIQGIKSQYLINLSHAKKIITMSLAAQKDNMMLSKEIETDILMRFACSKQISEAIKKIGLEPEQDFVLIVIGKSQSIDKLYSEVKNHLKTKFFSIKNSAFLKGKFKISKKQLESIISESPLEDLLVEKAAILFR